MNSVRRPEHGDAAVLALAAAPPLGPALDTTPAGLFAAPASAVHPPHLLPCAACGALNGRSALACWSCEADIVALAPFAQPAANRPIEPAAEPVAATGAVTVTVEAVDGRRGLHLVSRGEAAVSIEAAPPMPAPADLPVLTARLDGAVPAEDSALAPQSPKARRPDRSMVALAVAAIALLAAAAGLRWFAPTTAPAPVPSARSSPAPAAPSRDEARLERPFAAPAAGGAPDAALLSFPPVEVVPGSGDALRPARATPRTRPAPPPRAVSPPARPAPKPREIRETVSPPPAACTSNMAALGFCTLPPASAKE